MNLQKDWTIRDWAQRLETHSRRSLIGCLLVVVFLMMSCDGNSPTMESTKPSEHSSTTEPSDVNIASKSSHQKMLELLEDIRLSTPTESPYLGSELAQSFRKKLDALPADAPVMERLNLLLQVGKTELFIGKERGAIECLEEANDLLPRAIAFGLPPTSANVVRFELGVAYMRLAESENCCQRNSPESCILPIVGDGIHTEQNGSKQAIECFTKVLKNPVSKRRVHFEARWLLNIAYMTIGAYPDDVPTDYLIPAEAFNSEGEFPRFDNIASTVGLDSFSLSGGVIADDFDGDHDLDLMVSTWDTSGQIQFFRNNGDGTFADHSEPSGLAGIYGGLNLVQADYDNDGDVDVFVLRGAWLFDKGQHPNSLLQNDGNGAFRDVTIDAGLGGVHFPTQTASWADYDNDGDLDLFVGNESSPKLSAPCQLFQNQGDGTFVDVAERAGVTNMRFAKAAIWGDYDGDRFPDLYVSNHSALNRLYHNNGDGTFDDVAEQLNVAQPRISFPAWFWDVNNDGNLDLFVSAYGATIGDLTASYLDISNQKSGSLVPRLYLNNGNAGFEDVSDAWGLDRPSSPMGSNFGDLDNDGWLDFYLGTGDPAYKNLMPNKMYHNKNGEQFVDVTTAGGFGHAQKGHAVTFADFDNDGDQDIFEQMGGAYLGDKFFDALYENPGFENHWLAIKLIGTKSNRSAIGAQIKVMVDQASSERAIYKTVNSGGTFGGNPFRQTIGLGQADKIIRLEIFWPTTGQTQTFDNVRMDTWIQVVEGESTYSETPLQPIKMAAPTDND